jgi:uncharacterized protein (TIGR02996 family)
MAAPIPDEQAALLAAIVAQPDEDAARLVYADWLQEHGDEEQAAFIRDWISLDWLEDYEDEKRQKIATRLDRAATRNGVRWLEAIGIRWADPVYERGMADEVLYHGFDAFLAEAPVLFARVPVQELILQGVGGSESEAGCRDALFQLAAMPELGRLRTLRLTNGGWPVSSEGWEQFITSPYFAQLQVLSVQGAGLSDEDMLAFNRCGQLGNLEVLDLGGNNLTATGALSVVRSPHLKGLTRLILAGNAIVEDRRRGSPFLALRDALIERFDTASALHTW